MLNIFISQRLWKKKLEVPKSFPTHPARVMLQFSNPSAKFTGGAVKRGKKATQKQAAKASAQEKTQLQITANPEILGLLFIAPSISLSEEISDSQHRRFPLCVGGNSPLDANQAVSTTFTFIFPAWCCSMGWEQLCSGWVSLPWQLGWELGLATVEVQGRQKNHICVFWGDFVSSFKCLVTGWTWEPSPAFSLSKAAPGSIPASFPGSHSLLQCPHLE